MHSTRTRHGTGDCRRVRLVAAAEMVMCCVVDEQNSTGTRDRTGDLQRVRLTSQPLDHTCSKTATTIALASTRKWTSVSAVHEPVIGPDAVGVDD